MKANHSKTFHGFTLVELLVSMVITTIIITILVTVTVTSMDIWNRSRAEVRASLQAKAMVDSMAADFESMVVRRGNDFQWLFAEFAPATNSDGDVDGPNGNLSPSALDLIFFSAATDRYDGEVGDPNKDLGGDISTVGYKLVYKDPIGETSNDKYRTFVLYRKLVNPNDTFVHPVDKSKSLLGQTNLKTAFASYTATDEDLIEARKNFVCENVYQFAVKFHVEVTIPDPDAPATKTITSSTSVSLKNGEKDGEKFIITGNGLTSPPGLPAVTADQLAAGRISAVEISLTVLTDAAVKQMRGRIFKDEQLSDFIAANSYQYSKLIPVPSY
jgi:prepilin-type N-terminal cleavage/methylation domain-containing protein